MQYWNGGKNTPYHRWYHTLKRLYCYVIGHNRFSLVLDDDKGNWYAAEHCRRCEIVMVIGGERQHTPSLNLWVRWFMVRINMIGFFRKYNVKLERVLFPFKDMKG